MPQMSKIIQSRDEWKGKAVLRANEIREYRKSQKRYQKKISELKARIATLEKIIEELENFTKSGSPRIPIVGFRWFSWVPPFPVPSRVFSSPI